MFDKVVHLIEMEITNVVFKNLAYSYYFQQSEDIYSPQFKIMDVSKDDPKIERISTRPTSHSIYSNTISNKEEVDKKICRICLSDDHKNEELLKPCKCLGSLQLVHKSCLLEWIDRMMMRRLELGQQIQNIHCQICQQNLEIQHGQKLICRDKKEIILIMKMNMHIVIICATLMLMTIWTIGGLSFFKVHQKQGYGIQIEDTVFIIVITILVVHFFIWVGIFSYCFLLKWKLYVKEVRPMKNSHNKKDINQVQIVLEMPSQQPLTYIKNEPLSRLQQNSSNILAPTRNQAQRKKNQIQITF